MKQLFQNLKTGETYIENIPMPKVKKGSILIKTTHSLVSIGTERMLVEFGKANLFQKYRQKPEKVKQVLDKVKSEGLMPTLEAVFNKLDQPLPLGYCNVGTVIEIGSDVNNFAIGDRVVSNGSHAEIVCVPKNLVAHIPENVSDIDATFTVIGSIGLQGIRLLKPNFGENIVVIGLGLVGLISCQILKANGCNVIGIDVDQSKCELAKKWGVKSINSNVSNPEKSVADIFQGIGADGVIIAASSKSNDLISQAARMCRKNGRIILTGDVGLNINRADFYEKELSFQVSCSYGPGRYDDNYEQKGIDYPSAYVRWTEKRNFESILSSLENNSLSVKDLISNVVAFEDFNEIYDNMKISNSIANILTYSTASDQETYSQTFSLKNSSFKKNKCVVGIIGAGNFTRSTLLPALKKCNASLKIIASSDGINATDLAKKYKIMKSTSKYDEVLDDKEVNTVFITTRHDSHSDFVVKSIRAGKHTFIEKPLALNNHELEKIIETINEATFNNIFQSLNIGFNRRFSLHVEKIKMSLEKNNEPINIIVNMNAGHIPYSHWVHDSKEGGGRIVGEACHLIDICLYLSNSPVSSVCMNAMGSETNLATDNASILLKHKNGSNSVINYFSNGSKEYSKERVEVYSKERVWIIDNYRTTKAYGVKRFVNLKTRLDKGHLNQFKKYINAINTGNSNFISLDEMVNVTRASFAAIESLKKNNWIKIN